DQQPVILWPCCRPPAGLLPVWLAALGFTRQGRRPAMGRREWAGGAAWAGDGSWWRCGAGGLGGLSTPLAAAAPGPACTPPKSVRDHGRLVLLHGIRFADVAWRTRTSSGAATAGPRVSRAPAGRWMIVCARRGPSRLGRRRPERRRQ